MASNRSSEARRWFQQAIYDLKAAHWNRQGGFCDTACFLAQQAGEKGLKSLLYYRGARRIALLTHSLLQMVQECSHEVPALGEVMEDARTLDLHYIPSRYPNGLPSGYPHKFYGPDMAEQAIAAAEKIVTHIKTYYEERGETEILASDE